MFYLRHHDDQVTMYNSKCQTVVLVNFIKKQLKVDGNIDFIQQAADYKNAAALGIAERGDHTYANTFLQTRGTYILLQVQEDDEGTKEYTLLWKSQGDESERLAAALESKVADDRKKGGKAKAKK